MKTSILEKQYQSPKKERRNEGDEQKTKKEKELN